ncbi:LamG-like jellyroll fold domain-containing protein [Actinoplanes sp. NPDC026670]|uniref:LamG-like jellyroll fold domain-containing protein n=1 Tax=Actinoplanes sp. NPDC026670 TaxID=3154700 RepID=UPI0034052C11
MTNGIRSRLPGIALSAACLFAFSCMNAVPAAALSSAEIGFSATSDAAGIVLYAADWSSGLNGWAGHPSWKHLRGMLVNDGTGYGADPILAPYDTGSLADYTVEARVRMTRGAQAVPTSFGLAARRSAGGGGYSAAVRAGYPASIGYTDEGPWAWLVEGQPYVPDAGWHTYALRADGNVLTFLVDGSRIATTSDNRFLSGGLTGLFAGSYQLEVSSYRVRRLT